MSALQGSKMFILAQEIADQSGLSYAIWVVIIWLNELKLCWIAGPNDGKDIVTKTTLCYGDNQRGGKAL